MSTKSDTPGVATFAATSARQFVGCRVCGRTLLLGERSVGFFTQSGEGPFDVCELCVPRAHRYGLRAKPTAPEDLAGARRSGLLRRWGAAKRRPAVGASAPERRTKRRSSATASDPIALTAAPVGTAAIPLALAAFNQSSHARTLAGLHRTLGAPRSSVTPRSATDREVILTVAWEIVWYQFRIMPDDIEQERGQYLSDLHQRWQQWNCAVAPDGAVSVSDLNFGGSGHDPVHATPVEGQHR